MNFDDRSERHADPSEPSRGGAVMHPSFSEALLRENRRNLDRNVRNAYLRNLCSPAAAPPAEPVTLRIDCVHDDEALGRLAQLDGHPAPKGCHVVAEVGGVVVAAMAVDPDADGKTAAFADPFWPTAHLLPLLELRVRQLNGEPERKWRRLGLWGAVRRAARHA
ncbi:MAG TPA: hypothetical protein VGM80_01990 [Gaiellaceae bacterium]